MKFRSFFIVLLTLCFSACSTADSMSKIEQKQLFDQAVEQYRQQNYQQAMPMFQQATQAGHMKAARYIGLMYLNGEGVAKSPEQAFNAFSTAAERGDITSQYWLGYLYEKGIGVQADLTQARAWYEKSAARGDHISQPAIEALNRLNQSNSN